MSTEKPCSKCGMPAHSTGKPFCTDDYCKQVNYEEAAKTMGELCPGFPKAIEPCQQEGCEATSVYRKMFDMIKNGEGRPGLIFPKPRKRITQKDIERVIASIDELPIEFQPTTSDSYDSGKKDWRLHDEIGQFPDFHQSEQI